MPRLAAQLYPLRDLDRSVSDLLELIADAGLDGVEFAEFAVPVEDPVAVSAALDATALDPVAAMFPYGEPLEAMAAKLEIAINRYEPLGCTRFVVPRFDARPFDSTANLARKAEDLSTLATRTADRGADLLYHNHDVEFVSVEGGTAFDYLVEHTDLDFVLDVGWVAAAGHDPAALLRRLGDRVPVVHVKDVDTETGRSVVLGTGDVDLAACGEAAREASVEWLVYDHDDTADPLPEFEASVDVLASL